MKEIRINCLPIVPRKFKNSALIVKQLLNLLLWQEEQDAHLVQTLKPRLI
jgi:hypothetical protein